MTLPTRSAYRVASSQICVTQNCLLSLLTENNQDYATIVNMSKRPLLPVGRCRLSNGENENDLHEEWFANNLNIIENLF